MALAAIPTTSNALLDAKNAEANDPVYNQVEKMNQKSYDMSPDSPLMEFDAGSMTSTAATYGALYGLANAMQGGGGNKGGNKLGKGKGGGGFSKSSSGNDTNSTPSTWKKTKLKPWEIVLVVIFMARELRELKKGGGSNGSIKNANYEKSPIGQIKDSSDPRGQIVVNMFKITGNITDNVGRTLSNALAIFLLLMGTLEVLIGILKGVTGTNSEESKTVVMVIKDMFPQILTMGTLLLMLTNSFFWNFYTGPLFNLATKIGGMLSGQKFTMNNLPDYIAKLFDAPIAILLAGVGMMFSAKNVTNSILPTIILSAGLMLLWFCIKAVIEILTVLIDYLLIGCFSMVVMMFIALGFTRNIGSSVLFQELW